MKFDIGFAAALLCLTGAAVSAQDVAESSVKVQKLPLGPTVFDVGANRDGFHTYIIHGYHAGITNSDTGWVNVQINGLSADAVQATLNIEGANRPVSFTHVDPSFTDQPNGPLVTINYKLSETATIGQIQYTIFLSSKEPDLTALAYILSDGTGWTCDGSCPNPPGNIQVRVVSGKLVIDDGAGNVAKNVVYDPISRRLTADKPFVAGKFNVTYTKITWENFAKPIWNRQ